MSNPDHDKLEAIGQNEAWLAKFDTPRASPDLIRQIKHSVRRELACGRSVSGRESWRAWHGAFGAAASILLAVGVVWYSSGPATTDPGGGTADYFAFVERFEGTLDALADDGETADQLAAYVEDGDLALSGADLCDALESILSDDDSDEHNNRDVGALLPQGLDTIRKGTLG